MNANLSDPLLAKLCRFTVIDKVALTFAMLFVLGTAGVALLAYVALGDAPQARLWSFLASWAAIGLGIGIAAPWALCRSLHAAGHGVVAWRRQAPRPRTQPESLAPFLQGRTA